MSGNNRQPRRIVSNTSLPVQLEPAPFHFDSNKHQAIPALFEGDMARSSGDATVRRLIRRTSAQSEVRVFFFCDTYKKLSSYVAGPSSISLQCKLRVG